MSNESCLFCRIVAGKIPADFVHQDERCVVIRDINPQAPVHVLVIPREHLESLDDAAQTDEPLLGHLLRVGARVTNEEGHAESGYRTVINTGA
ncbi:MAG TPA: histidine triad nucleotide-binding protein, partial [Pyrinomonadaceae bacterium]